MRKRGRPKLWDIERQEHMIDAGLKYSDLGSGQRTYLQKLAPFYKYRKMLLPSIGAIGGFGAYKMKQLLKKKSFGKNAGTKKTKSMPMYRKRKRFGRKARNTYRRKRFRKRKPRYKKRGGRRKTYKASRIGIVKRALAVAVPMTLMQADSYKYQAGPGFTCYIPGGCIRDFNHYNKVLTATDVNSTPFGNTDLSASKQYSMKAGVRSTLFNAASIPCWVQPVIWWVKKDLRDSDYDGDADNTEMERTLLEMMYQGYIAQADTTDDANVSIQAADANNRFKAKICAQTGVNPIKGIAKEFFGWKFGSRRSLKAGAERSIKLGSNKIKRINPHLYSKSGNHTATGFRGHTKGILWIVEGTFCGTDEADGGLNNDEKVGRAGYTVMVEERRYHTMKALDTTARSTQYENNLHYIAPANEQVIEDVDMQVAAPEEL